VIAQTNRREADSFAEDPSANEEPASIAACGIASLREELAAFRKELQEIKAIQSPLVGIEQVARYFGKSPDTIRRWVNDRAISCYKIPNNKGHTLLFSFKKLESDLEEYQQERF